MKFVLYIEAATLGMLCFGWTCSMASGQERIAKADSKIATTAEDRNTASSLATSPSGYVVGAGDVLNILVWKESDISQTVVVRPDGKISIPLLGEVAVLGMSPSQLGQLLQTSLQAIVVDPRVTVTVVEIHSRLVYITGEIVRPGAYPLNNPITVLQLIAQAGGLTEFAKKKIRVVHARAGDETWVSYKDLIKGVGVHALSLNPGDTVVIQ